MSHPRRITRSSTAVEKSRVASSRTPAYSWIRASSSAVEQGTLNHTAIAKAVAPHSLAKSSGRPPVPAHVVTESPGRPIPLYTERARRLIEHETHVRGGRARWAPKTDWRASYGTPKRGDPNRTTP